MQLRPYQSQAVEAVYQHLRERDDNPCVVLPTGSGKTPCIATICRDVVQRWQGRVLVLAHVKELLAQSVEKLHLVAPDLEVGVCSAGLGRIETAAPVLVAGIQTIYRRAFGVGRFDLVLIDEAHLLSPEGEGMYRSFLAAAKTLNPRVRLVGFTATPFRLKQGPMCAPEHLLNHVCYEVGVKELIRDGYLAPLVAKAPAGAVDPSALHVRAGEFVADEAEALMDQEGVVRAACAEIAERTQDRRATLIFAAGVAHGRHVAGVLREAHGLEVGEIYGDTPAVEREALVERFRSGALRHLVNVAVLTTGFDAPATDCVALLRPTLSPGLYSQMCGRGLRLAPGKANCLILDFGGNVVRHGPIDALRVDRVGAGGGEAPAKACPACQALIATGFQRCPECGHAFPPPQRARHEGSSSGAGVLTGQISETEHKVRDVFYSVHAKRDADPAAPKSMRVEYLIGWQRYQSEWVCVEHSGFARQKAEVWWRARSLAPVPRTASEAVALAEGGALCPTHAITVRAVAGEPYDRIVAHQLGEKPPWREMGDVDEPAPAVSAAPYDDDEPPF